jgi:hypothetical protein
MRRAASSIRFAILWSLLIVPACFDLPKADVSTRVLDDFAEDAGPSLMPTWQAFNPWSCGAFATRDQDNGDAGPDGGPPSSDAGTPTSPDGSTAVLCTLGLGDTDPHALAATFDLAAPTADIQLGVEVVTQTLSGAVVDLTGFKTLQFNAKLFSTTRPTDLPSGTQLEVELGCSAVGNGSAVDQFATTLVAEATLWDPVILALGDFRPTPSTRGLTACLGAVDSIRFVVRLGTGTGPVSGTLRLDHMVFTTK